MMGVLDTPQWRRQEHMWEDSLHWSPVLRNGGRDDNLIRYVPEYYKSRGNALDYHAEATIYPGPGHGSGSYGREHGDIVHADLPRIPGALVDSALFAFKRLF